MSRILTSNLAMRRYDPDVKQLDGSSFDQLSALAWSGKTGRLYGLRTSRLFEINGTTLKVERQITLTGFNDLEGLAWMGPAASGGEGFGFAEEGARDIYHTTINSGTSTISRASCTRIKTTIDCLPYLHSDLLDGDTIDDAGHGFAHGTPIRYKPGTTGVNELAEDTRYYAYLDESDRLQIATVDPTDPPPEGVTPITLTASGSGYFYILPDDNKGIEALAYNPATGVWYAGKESTSTSGAPYKTLAIYEVESDGSTTLLFTPGAPYTGTIRDMHFDPATGHLFIAFKVTKYVVEYDLSGNVIASWVYGDTPPSIEGLAITPNIRRGNLWLGSDSSTACLARFSIQKDNKYADLIREQAPKMYFRCGEESGETKAIDETGLANLDYTAQVTGATFGHKGIPGGGGCSCINLVNDPTGVGGNSASPGPWAELSGVAAGMSQLTFDAWFCTPIVDSKRRTILSLQDPTTAANYFGLYIQSGTLRGFIRGGTELVGAAFKPGKWNHAALVISSTTARSLYLNGVKVASETSGTSRAFPTNPVAIGLGITRASSGPILVYDGKLAEAAIWYTALSEAQILGHYKLGRGGRLPQRLRPVFSVMPRRPQAFSRGAKV